jgi:hypothetical protein
VQRPVGGEEPRVFVRIAVAEHDLLDLLAERRAVLRHREQVGHHRRRVLEVAERLEQRHRQAAKPISRARISGSSTSDTLSDMLTMYRPNARGPTSADGLRDLADRPDRRLERLAERMPGGPQRPPRAQLATSTASLSGSDSPR